MRSDDTPGPVRSWPRALELIGGAALVTANQGKLAEAQRLCGTVLEAVTLELPEIQSLDLLEVLTSKAAEAFQRLQRPLIVDETGLELAALNRFPGPLVKWMLAAVGPDGLAGTAEALGDTRATARCALLYRDRYRAIVAQGSTEGCLVLPPRGELGFGWDPIFQPNGLSRTYGELAAEQKDRVSHRGHAWRNLLDLLDSVPRQESKAGS